MAECARRDLFDRSLAASQSRRIIFRRKVTDKRSNPVPWTE
jgi:hypothetical protein